MHFRTALFIYFLLSCMASNAQTLGGNAVYNFLKLPASPWLSAAGGVNVSIINEPGLAHFNPALMKADGHSQIHAGFNGLPGGIKAYALGGIYHHDKLRTTFGSQLYFVNYGSIIRTDASGNEMGEFRPSDFAFQISASRQYSTRVSYAGTLKFIQSNYGQYKSNAFALDAGLHYYDSAANFSAGLVARNMGFQLKTYAGEGEDLPFDLSIGFTKKLEKAPLGFSVTAQHLQRFDILYEDTTFNQDNGFNASNGFGNKLLNHFIIAAHIYAGEHLEATIGYNRLRRTELNVGPAGNGLNGFSMGLRLKFLKLQVLYARSHYQKNVAYNQLGFNLHFNRLMNREL